MSSSLTATRHTMPWNRINEMTVNSFRGWRSAWSGERWWLRGSCTTAPSTGRACCTRGTSSARLTAGRSVRVPMTSRSCWGTAVGASHSRCCPATETRRHLHRWVRSREAALYVFLPSDAPVEYYCYRGTSQLNTTFFLMNSFNREWYLENRRLSSSEYKVQGCFIFHLPDTLGLFLQGSPSQQRYKHTIITRTGTR